MPTSTRATSDARRVAGFTLIELALVLLIMGILATLAAPSLSVLGRARIDGEAQRLASMVSYLHDESALRGTIYRLAIDIDEDRYEVGVAREDSGEFASPRSAEGWDPYAAESHDLPAGVTLEKVETATGPVTTGTAFLYFVPEDGREGFSIVLESEDGAVRTLAIDGVTGRVDVTAEGDVP